MEDGTGDIDALGTGDVEFDGTVYVGTTITVAVTTVVNPTTRDGELEVRFPEADRDPVTAIEGAIVGVLPLGTTVGDVICDEDLVNMGDITRVTEIDDNDVAIEGLDASEIEFAAPNVGDGEIDTFPGNGETEIEAIA